MSEADVLYAAILDRRLRSEQTVQAIEDEAAGLREQGRLAIARDLIDRALQGSALMPQFKQRLREFAARELTEEPAT